MSQTSIKDYASSHQAVECIAKRGAVLIMRPHLLHSSKKGTHPSERRILHLEFSRYPLPNNIDWA